MLEGLSRCEPARNTRKPPSLGATMRCAGQLPEVDGLDEQPWIHEGTIRSSLPLTFSGASRRGRPRDPRNGQLPGVQRLRVPCASVDLCGETVLFAGRMNCVCSI